MNVNGNGTTTSDGLVNANKPELIINNLLLPTEITSITKQEFISNSAYNNMYGYSITNEDNYKPLPNISSTEAIKQIKTTDSPSTSGDNTTIYLGAKVDLSISAGNYANTVIFTAVANLMRCEGLTDFNLAFCEAGKEPIIKDDNNYYKMQDMTSEICDAVSIPDITSGALTTQLVDVRDGKLYWVSKLADANCWMSQNLKLELDNTVALTSNDTDLNIVKSGTGYVVDENGVISWTPANSTIKYDDAETGKWASNNTIPYSYDYGDKYYFSSGANAADVEYTDLASCIADEHTQSDCEHYQAGNYYNWPAAVASNVANTDYALKAYINAENSICPKGWRLPTTHGGASSVVGKWKSLLTTTYAIPASAAGSIALRSAPFWLTRAGRLTTGATPTSTKTNGYYWSSTFYTAANAFFFNFSGTSFNATGNQAKGQSASIRCMARIGREYIVSFDPTTGENAPESLAADSDNASYTFTLPSEIPTREGHVFLGWDTDPEAIAPTYVYNHTKSIFVTPSITIDSEHTNTTLYAIWNKTFDDAFIEAGKTQSEGYYLMQDMTPDICSAVHAAPAANTSPVESIRLKDSRDNNLYYVAKLADGNCWMTQNLDLNLSNTDSLTSLDSDINANYQQAIEPGSEEIDNSGYSIDVNGVISWTPSNTTLTPDNVKTGWINDDISPSSYDPGVKYSRNGTMALSNWKDTAEECSTSTVSVSDCEHWTVGNYYSWSAAVAMNDTSAFTTTDDKPANSICPKGWRLFTGTSNSDSESYAIFKTAYSLGNSTTKLSPAPFYYLRAGYISARGALTGVASSGDIWSNSAVSATNAYRLYYTYSNADGTVTQAIYPWNSVARELGFHVRCLAR